MRGNSPMKVAVAATAIVLFAAGCQKTEEPTATSGGGILRINTVEASSLIAGMANDNPSIIIIKQLYAGLVEYDAKTSAPKNVVAESIESTDNKVWTIKLKKGFKFSNGEETNADSFINAWNWTSYGPNAAQNSDFLGSIEGWEDLQSGKDPDGDGPQKAPEPKSKTMAGLKKLDEYSFQVTLGAAFVGFPAVVGYSGFYPMAKGCISDVNACKEKPITNGRYHMESSWKHNVEVKLVRNDSYPGEKAKNAGLFYKIYDKVDTAYADYEAGELDVMEAIPATKYKDAKSKFADVLFEKPNNSFTYLGFPLYLPQFQNAQVRQAISLAIDRQTIIDSVFDGRFSVAQGVVSPNFQGYRPNSCEFCKYDPAKAKSLLDAAGGWKGGKLILWGNAGQQHEKWLQPLGDMLKKNLGIDYELKVDLQFVEYQQATNGKKVTGAFRLGWGPDYPVLETYLFPLYGTKGSSNNPGYTNAQFDSLVAQGNGAKSLEDGIKFYQQAEDIIVKDLPVAPLWFGKTTNVYSKNVVEYKYNPISGTEFHEIALKG
jgi:ABC-type oligopeptide transport system substrate-binding subunit